MTRAGARRSPPRRHEYDRTDRRPNIILVVLDDCGFAQLGCFGSEIETTTIDRLAQDGVRMNAFHVTALCSPSIAAARARRSSSFSTSAPIPAPLRAGVVLAAGGFSRNSEFRRRHQPVGRDWTGAADGDTGDAI